LLPYLAEHPPVHLLVAGLAGFKPRRGPEMGPRDLLQELGPAFAARDPHEGLPAVILDFDRLKAEAMKKRSSS
jgi:hypothetical protein